MISDYAAQMLRDGMVALAASVGQLATAVKKPLPTKSEIMLLLATEDDPAEAILKLLEDK